MRILRSILHACVDVFSIMIHPASKLLGKDRIRILYYHRICDLPKTNDVMASVNVPPAAFGKQMAFLSRSRFNVITLEQLIDCRENNIKPPPKTLIITFDDGYRDNYLNALPILEKYNFKGTFFLVTDYIGSDRIFHWLKLGEKSLVHSHKNKKYWLPLSRQEILKASAHGACFGTHTKTHPHLSNLDKSRVMEELVGSMVRLQKILQKRVRCFSYPYGDMNEMVRQCVQVAGYRAAVTIEEGSNTLKSDFLKMKRIVISGQDSFAKFVRKVDGAYDLVPWRLPIVKLGQIIFRK